MEISLEVMKMQSSIRLLGRLFVALLGLSLSICVFVIALNFNLLVSFADFLGILNVLATIGFDSDLIKKIPVVGYFFQVAPFDRMTMAYIFAGVLAFALSAGLVLAFYYLFRVVRLLIDFKSYSQGERLAYFQTLIFNLFLLFVVAIATYFIARWNIELYHYRAVNQWLGNVEQYAENIDAQMQRVDILDSQYARYWAVSLISRSRMSYLFVTFLACLMVELTFESVKKRASLLGEAFGNLFAQSQTTETKIDSTAPTVVPDTQLIEREANPNLTTAGEEAVEETALSAESEVIPQTQTVQDQNSTSSVTENRPARRSRFRFWRNGEGSSMEGVERLRNFEVGNRNSSEGAKFEVIGAPGRFVALEEALAHPEEYIFDPETNRVYSRNLFEMADKT